MPAMNVAPASPFTAPNASSISMFSALLCLKLRPTVTIINTRLLSSFCRQISRKRRLIVTYVKALSLTGSTTVKIVIMLPIFTVQLLKLLLIIMYKDNQNINYYQFNMLAFYACFFNPRCACSSSNIVISKITTTMQINATGIQVQACWVYLQQEHSTAIEGWVISSYPLSFEMYFLVMLQIQITRSYNRTYIVIYTSTNQSKSPGSDLDNMHIPYLYHLFILNTQIISTVWPSHLWIVFNE